MPSSRDPAINRQKANEYRIAHPEWHRRTNREWAAKKRAADPEWAKAAAKKFRGDMSAEQKAARAEYMRRWHEAHPGYTANVQKRDHALYPAKRMVEGAKRRAEKDGLAFDLDWREITVPQICPVLGIRLTSGSGGFQDGSPSLDRLLPQLGYTKENVRVISYRANAIKRDATLAEMEAIVAYMRRELA